MLIDLIFNGSINLIKHFNKKNGAFVSGISKGLFLSQTGETINEFHASCVTIKSAELKTLEWINFNLDILI